MLFKNTIYVEEELKNHPSVKDIIHKLKTQNIIYIKHYKDILNQTGGNWDVQKKYQKIILAHRKENFFYQGSYLTPNFGYDLFFYNTLAINCLYDCSYCYLQGMYNTPHLVIFVNNVDFINATKELLKKHANKKIYLALSYDTDLPAIEHLYPYCAEWINFAKENNNLTIEIRTKSNNISFLNNILPIDNVILAWSILPEKIIHLFEPATPNLKQRISAINQAVSNGWKVMLCIDPLIAIPDYKTIYSDFIKQISIEIPLQKIHKISLGTFRMNADFFKNVKKNKLSMHPIYNYPYHKKNNIIEYPEEVKKMLIKEIIENIKLNDRNKFEIYE